MPVKKFSNGDVLGVGLYRDSRRNAKGVRLGVTFDVEKDIFSTKYGYTFKIHLLTHVFVVFWGRG